jgi:hypothetical protein
LLAEGYDVIGFDIERHDYGDGGYPAQLVLQDVLTLHGSQFRDAALIVASPPCQEYSYMAMPWSRAKAIAAEYRSGVRDVKKLTALFDACFRIQREAIEAAGHFIPLVVENVRGAIPWVGRSRWNYGSYHLWGDVPALMPITKQAWRDGFKEMHGSGMGGGQIFGKHNPHIEGTKTTGHANQRDGYGHTRHLTNQRESDGIKDGGDCFSDPEYHGRAGGSKNGKPTTARKAASAAIAKIPLPLARYIASTFRQSGA